MEDVLPPGASLPKPGQKVRVLVGEPISFEDLRLRTQVCCPLGTCKDGGVDEQIDLLIATVQDEGVGGSCVLANSFGRRHGRFAGRGP